MSWRSPANEGWLRDLPGVRRDQPLARNTSFNIGGPADYFLESETPAELVAACDERGIPYRLLGAGTNLLISDAGVEGVVIRCVNRGWTVHGREVVAQAGLKMMRLARICAEHDLIGFEWAIGVPGTIGGAVCQNAGCWGGQLSDVLLDVAGLIPGEGPRRWQAGELGLGYRSSALRQGRWPGALVETATIRLAPGDGAAAKGDMARLTVERNRTQPIKSKNCGSVFKNPPGDSAGRLIEAAGLRGAREGAAQISEQHANFIINHGGATAADVLELIERARRRVRERFGLDLEPEVEAIGREAVVGRAS
ncbi:MAG: UDP-N-acetylmuramate dehydrogenase [Candidatus Dormibacteraeota bacterium]|uniref:UDP-N-acetylenolpyruvoylglucosamine reductase n=1 Tax=Candidatus Dormiibacter inghamiae TaxID=3127013 RepID=A0A934ND10_9BACT|nr:UDP-N-acetylmuramate dehydrogenase [Candidatus Dormibacteraeota bacterium]MBJ7605812.1 UDP-N-acetylmuramate dehydrogenase [Candidatus Dormibacteraeota bacterium]